MHRLNESRPGSTSPDICNRPSGTSYPLYHPANLYYRPPIDMKHTPGVSTNHSLNSKPRIWSLADMASKEEKHPSDAKLTPPSALPGLYPSSAGKIVSPLPSRMHYPPFFKPRDAVVSSIFSPFFCLCDVREYSMKWLCCADDETFTKPHTSHQYIQAIYLSFFFCFPFSLLLPPSFSS